MILGIIAIVWSSDEVSAGMSVYVGLPMRTIAHASIHIPDRDTNSRNSLVNPFGQRIETKKEATDHFRQRIT